MSITKIVLKLVTLSILFGGYWLMAPNGHVNAAATDDCISSFNDCANNCDNESPLDQSCYDSCDANYFDCGAIPYPDVFDFTHCEHQCLECNQPGSNCHYSDCKAACIRTYGQWVWIEILDECGITTVTVVNRRQSMKRRKPTVPPFGFLAWRNLKTVSFWSWRSSARLFIYLRLLVSCFSGATFLRLRWLARIGIMQPGPDLKLQTIRAFQNK